VSLGRALKDLFLLRFRSRVLTAPCVSLVLRGRVADISGPAGSSSAPPPLYFMSRITTVTSGTLLALVASVVTIFH
jgi:hypothetical protein